jgi:hypothetical protein
MNSNYGFDLESKANKPAEVARLLAQFLNNGHLSLLLGSGVSVALNFPNWTKLVTGISSEILPGRMVSSNSYTGTELKQIIQEVKDEINNVPQYLNLVKKHLYSGVTFDFDLAKKELLIALSALIIGKNRGNVHDIITYNFDSVLEWYLGLMGLKVETFTKKQFMSKNADVVIAHIHGYLPHSSDLGKGSTDILFSNEEFQDRMLGRDYWKEYFYEYFRRHTFLAVGMSADSIYNDVCPYLRQMDDWYKEQNVVRRLPYGVAMLTPGSDTEKKIPMLIKSGIIPCIYDHKDMPNAIFEIVQIALAATA